MYQNVLVSERQLDTREHTGRMKLSLEVVLLRVVGIKLQYFRISPMWHANIVVFKYYKTFIDYELMP